MLEIRDRIDRKIREQLHPKDLFYQILDGLRSLTRYDHSSALLIRDGAGDTMEIAAEQIAWTKAKSPRIGRRLALRDDVKEMLDTGRICGFDRRGESLARVGRPSRSASWRSGSTSATRRPARVAGTVDALRAARRTRRRVRRAEGRRPARRTA